MMCYSEIESRPSFLALLLWILRLLLISEQIRRGRVGGFNTSITVLHPTLENESVVQPPPIHPSMGHGLHLYILYKLEEIPLVFYR